MLSDLPASVQAEVRRILDAEARRLLAEQLDRADSRESAQRSASTERADHDGC